MRRRWIALALLAVFALAGLSASPASAATPTLNVGDAAQPANGSCTSAPYSFTAYPPAGYSEVDVFLSVSDYDYNSVGYLSSSSPSGSGNFTLCGVTNKAYKMDMDVTYCTSSYSTCQNITGPTVQFYVGPRPVPPAPTPTCPISSEVKLKAPTTKYGIKLKVTRIEHNSDCTSEVVGGRIQLEKYVHGKWVAVGGKTKTYTGKTTLYYETPPRPIKVRIKTFNPTSYSNAVKIG